MLDCEYANFQIHLSARYLNAGGAHRTDEAYLSLCATRIASLQSICHSLDRGRIQVPSVMRKERYAILE